MADMNWNEEAFSAIATESSFTKGFQGTLDGNNKTIEGLRLGDSQTRAGAEYAVGLFGTIYNGIVKNLEIKDATITSGGTEATAFVAGILYNGTVENVKVTGESSLTSSIRSGAIVGSLKGTKSIINNCENYATVNVNGMYGGGIVGAAHYGSGSKITKCVNYGAVNGKTEVGGIVGYADRATVENCVNRGAVTGTGNYGVGGVVGFDACNKQLIYPKNGSTIVGCENYGTVTGPNHVGGILGTFAMTPGDAQPSNVIYSTIENCVNYGNVVGTEKAGTIFGYQHSYGYGDADDKINNLQVKLIGCKNEGTLNGEATDSLTASAFVVIE